MKGTDYHQANLLQAETTNYILEEKNIYTKKTYSISVSAPKHSKNHK